MRKRQCDTSYGLELALAACLPHDAVKNAGVKDYLSTGRGPTLRDLWCKFPFQRTRWGWNWAILKMGLTEKA